MSITQFFIHLQTKLSVWFCSWFFGDKSIWLWFNEWVHTTQKRGSTIFQYSFPTRHNLIHLSFFSTDTLDVTRTSMRNTLRALGYFQKSCRYVRVLVITRWKSSSLHNNFMNLTQFQVYTCKNASEEMKLKAKQALKVERSVLFYLFVSLIKLIIVIMYMYKDDDS